MLKHLKMIWKDRPDGGRTGTYADPQDPSNWIDDPCSWCGGESSPAFCPRDGRLHHHGAIHRPEGSGFGYLCRSLECEAKAKQEWLDARRGYAYLKEQSQR